MKSGSASIDSSSFSTSSRSYMRPVNLVGIGPRGRFSSFLNPGLAPFFPFGGAGGPKSRARAGAPGPSPGRPWAPKATRTRAAETSARTAGTRAGVAAAGSSWTAGTRRTVAAWTRARRRAAILAGASFAHRQRTPHEELTVEALDRLLGRGAIGVLDEGEPAGPPGLAIERANDLGRCADLREVGAQVVFGGLIRQVADEQSH